MDIENTRRRFLTKAAAGIAAGYVAIGHAATKKKPPKQRPNILWVISEDTGPEFGCYGDPSARTPNVDRLAREGALYTNAFTSAPVCSPSRSAFMTGMYQTTIGAHNHRSHRGDDFKLPEGVFVFTKYLRDAGYLTALPAKRKKDWNFNPKVKPYNSFKWGDLKNNQPFFAQVQFSETHRGGAWNKAAKDPKYKVDPDKVDLPSYYPDHPVARQDWADYIATVNALDAKIGDVLKRLEDDGLADNTIVFYFGDHGRAMVRGKQWLYDGGIHIPLVIRWPGHIKPGTVVDEMVSAIDFSSTCLKLAGVEVPEHMQGRVFLGPERDEPREYIFAARDRCDETVDRIRCARDKQYKYIRNFMPERPYTQLNRYKERQYPVLALLKRLHAEGELTPEQELFMADTRPEEELFDVKADRWEVNNLADSPEHQDVLKKMRRLLDNWIERTGDKGENPEPPEVTRRWEKRMSETYDRDRQTKAKRLPKKGAIPRRKCKILDVSSQETQASQQAAGNIFDGDPMTCWHTQWKKRMPGFPHEITIDLGETRTITGLQILPRQDRAQNGRIERYEVYISDDNSRAGKPVAKGKLKNALDEQEIKCTKTRGRYLRMRALSGYSKRIAAIAEMTILGK